LRSIGGDWGDGSNCPNWPDHLSPLTIVMMMSIPIHRPRRGMFLMQTTATNAEISDPIVERFAQDSITKLGLFYSNGLHTLYRLKRSASKNPNVTVEERRNYNLRIDETRRLLTSYRPHIVKNARTRRSRPSLSYPDIVGRFQEIERQLDQNLAYLHTERRRAMIFVTDVDAKLLVLVHDFKHISERLELLKGALGVPTSAKAIELIYQQVLSDHLAQDTAPFLFDVVEYIIKLRIESADKPFETDTTSQGIAHLARSAKQLLAALEQSNADRRFVSAVREYSDALTHKFSPILVDLLSNRLRSFIVELRSELSGFVIAEITALLLSQDQVLRQFPEWQQFSKAASEFRPTIEFLREQQTALTAVARETRNTPSVAASEVIGALDRLEEAGSQDNTRETINLGVWRSFENFIKSNVGKMVETMKSLSETVSSKQDAYLRYIDRILPYIKVVVKMRESLHWLIPVIEWMEEISRKSRK
jgi:hypothetical protein